MRVYPGAVEIAADQLILANDVERRPDPACSAVVGPDLIAAVRLGLEENDGGAFVRSLRDEFNRAVAAEAAEADRNPLGRNAGLRGQALRTA